MKAVREMSAQSTLLATELQHISNTLLAHERCEHNLHRYFHWMYTTTINPKPYTLTLDSNPASRIVYIEYRIMIAHVQMLPQGGHACAVDCFIFTPVLHVFFPRMLELDISNSLFFCLTCADRCSTDSDPTSRDLGSTHCSCSSSWNSM